VSRLGLRSFAIGYVALLVLAPLGLVTYRTLIENASQAWQGLSEPSTVHAFEITAIAVGIAVPVNTVFGVICALAIVRRRFPGKGLVNAFVDLPLALSPVVVGVSLYVLYGRTGWFGPFLARHDFRVLFALPAIVLATIFVSVPFVAREVIPTLREIGDDQEQAAHTLGASGWQTFWRITLPSIRWAIIYGVVTTAARGLGEYGSIVIIGGATLTAAVQVDAKYQNFALPGAYAIALVLAAIAIAILVLMNLVRPKEQTN
jgi:sulfate transport system permease protein